MLAIPLPAETRRKMLGRALIYQSGRISAYAGLGLFFGLAGKGLAMAGFQQALSLIAGVSMILAAFYAYHWERAAMKIPGLRQATQYVKKQLGYLINKDSIAASWSMGLLNGFLPCGLVYAALAGAIASATPWLGAAFMMVFGLGTIPLLLFTMTAGKSISIQLRKKFQIIQPMLLAITGILLISRGLHLDLSLFESAVPPAQLDCH
jgi:hypothetical protein